MPLKNSPALKYMLRPALTEGAPEAQTLLLALLQAGEVLLKIHDPKACDRPICVALHKRLSSGLVVPASYHTNQGGYAPNGVSNLVRAPRVKVLYLSATAPTLTFDRAEVLSRSNHPIAAQLYAPLADVDVFARTPTQALEGLATEFAGELSRGDVEGLRLTHPTVLPVVTSLYAQARPAAGSGALVRSALACELCRYATTAVQVAA